MNALEQRIDAHIKAEAEEAEAEAGRLQKKHAKLLAQATALSTRQAAVFGRLGKQKPATSKQAATIDELHRLARLERELSSLNEQIATVAKLKVTLASRAEFKRRVQLAADIGATEEPIPGPRAAQLVLEHTGRAMSVPEVTRVLFEAGLVAISGKTPTQTISGYMAKSNQQGGPFVRIGKGSYALRDANPVAG